METGSTYFIRIKLLVLIIFFIGCSKSSDESSDTEADAALLEEAAMEKPADPIPAAAVAYKLNSWDDWKEEFDDDEKDRAELGLKTLGILISHDRQDEVTVFYQINDLNAADEIFKEEKADTTFSKPAVALYQIVSMPAIQFSQQYRVTINHEVEDFDRWRLKFDEFEPIRKEAGLELVGIARGASNQNYVSVMFAFDDLDGAKLFAESDEHKNAMDESGVIGDPVLYWYNVPPEK